jgi:hypothetical protein
MGVFLLSPCLFLGALELEFTGGINSLTFHPDRVTGHVVSRSHKEFQSYPYILGDIIVRSNSFDKFGYKIHASRDNILRNSLFAQAKTNWEYINLEFGPFVGMEDTLESVKKPELGVIGGVELAFPGIVFFSLSGSSTLGSKFDFFSNNTRETGDVKIGFWLPYVIPSLSASIKSYTNRPDDSVEIRDELIRLMISADIYNKNFPFLFRVEAGYEIFSRSYERDGSSVKDELIMIFTGVEAKYQINKMIKVILGFEIPVYGDAVKPMESPIVLSLFKAYTGVGINLY